MGDQDDDFELKLGRIGDRRARPVAPYVKRVLRESEKAGGYRSGQRHRFSGARIGQGRAQGTIAAIRRRAPGARRVIIKARIVRMKGPDLGAARAHLRYVQRDGVTREGEPGTLYDAGHDRADGKAFLERSSDDRHQFRFIVSAEDGAGLADLKPFVRDLMRQMEQDLGTKLDWVAADHFNTGQPHTHIVLRGKDERGADLVIARDYIGHGMRARASDLVTRELGPETELERVRKLEREVAQERFTRLDRAILRDATGDAISLSAKPERDPRRQTLRIGRLRMLERLGLASEMRAGLWRISPDLASTLRRMGERGDIIKTMHRELRSAGLDRANADHSIFDAADPRARLAGSIVAEGFSDELQERRYLIIDGIDGRTHYVETGVRSAHDEPLLRNMIVEVDARAREPRDVDRTIAEIAARHGGVYSAGLHRATDPRASDEYVATHVRRLEALRRERHVERRGDGSWRVGNDYLDRAARFEATNRSRMPVQIRVLSWQAIDALPSTLGATWLDRELVGRKQRTPQPFGFGASVEEALDRRRRWLIAEGLARIEQHRTVYARNLLDVLRRRELAKFGAEMAQEIGVGYAQAKTGDEVRGTYRRSLTLASGRFAVIERAHDFTLVPWRPVLERAKGQTVVGIVGGEGVSWSIGRKRGLGR
ncbi:MAG: DUF3363 domain-containing protein [Rhizobiales bacterium]|nr:DUF3363 domain-containing protein [Hyphomicrobiales bacterium]